MCRLLPILLLLLTSCVGIPEARQLAVSPNAAPPRVEADGTLLDPARSRQMLADAGRNQPVDAALKRQVAVEGQTAGTPLTAGNRVTLIEDGPATYDSMMRLILAARTSIMLESYLFDGDSVGTAISDLLIERRRAGVTVRVMYDSIGSGDTPAAFWERLRQAGVEVVAFDPLSLGAPNGFKPNDRDHRKLLVVDGKTALLGGVNISEVYLYGGSESGSDANWRLGWRDTDVEIEGPVAARLAHIFLDSWARQGGALTPADRAIDAAPAQGSALVRPLPGDPQAGDPEIYVALLSAIRHAQQHVWITSAFFDPPPEALSALEDAARRGVDVTLVLPAESTSQATLAAGRSHYDALLAAGVKIYERDGVYLHAKTTTIDSVWSEIGSANLDARSVIWNDEIGVIVLDHGFATEMEAAFVRDRAASRRIDPVAWSDRPLIDRLSEWGSRLFEGLL